MAAPMPVLPTHRQYRPMPRKTTDETLEGFIRRQDAATLAATLLELARDQAAVRDRLVRLQLANQPKALAAGFRKTLAGWRRSTKFLGYSQAGAFGRELEAWLGQVERELMPKDPGAALALAEAFVESDAAFFNHADDSGGAVGEAVRAGCRLWLKAAARCESPAVAWPGRIAALLAADEYGAREELLRRASILLDEPALLGMVTSYEVRLDEALAQQTSEAEGLNWQAAKSAAALSLLAEALRDPDVLVRAVLRRSPSPNPVQKETLIRAYLDWGRPEGALPWLEGSWAHLEGTQQRLHAQVLTQLGRTGDAASIRQHIFEGNLAVSDLHAWLELLPPTGQGTAIEHAATLSMTHADPVVVALLRLDIGDDAGAEAALTAAPGRIGGRDHATLVPLAEALEERGRWTGATAVYQALLVAIPEKGYTPAYRHGARYWAWLQGLAQKSSGLMPLKPPEAFEAGIRAKHARKSSFWSQVGGARPVDVDERESREV